MHVVFLKKRETATDQAPNTEVTTKPPQQKMDAATQPPAVTATHTEAVTTVAGNQPATATPSAGVQIILLSSKTTPAGQKAISLSAKQVATIRRLAANQAQRPVAISVRHRVDVPIQKVVATAIQQGAKTQAAGVPVVAAKKADTETPLRGDAAPTVQEASPLQVPQVSTVPVVQTAVAQLWGPTPDLTPVSGVVVPLSQSTPVTTPQKMAVAVAEKPSPGIKVASARVTTRKKTGAKQAVTTKAKKKPTAQAQKRTSKTDTKPAAKLGKRGTSTARARKVVLSDPVEGQNVITLPLHDDGDGSVQQVVVETLQSGSTSGQEAPTSITYTLQEGNKTVYLCSSCPYSTPRKGHLIEHERMHTGEKPFKCRYCNYATSRNCHLKDHERTHSGEKPFKCCLCDYSANRKHHLQDHIKTHIKKRKMEPKERQQGLLALPSSGSGEA